MRKTKWLAVLADVVLVLLVIGGAAWLFLAGLPPAEWTTDRPLLPLSVDWSRILIALTAAGVILGILLAAFMRRRADRVVDGEAIRYGGYQRLVHWALAIGFVLDFATAAWILRWFGLRTSPDMLPTLYLVHFIGAGLITFAAATFVTTSRIRGEDALFPRWRDVGPAIARLFGYLGVYGEPGLLGMGWPKSWRAPTQRFLAVFGVKPLAREEKFLAAEKVLSFTPLAIVAVIVIGTGLIKAARYFFVVPPDVLYWTTWLHDLSTWLVLIVVAAHIAATFLVPRNWPGIRAMVTGRMRLHVIQEEFPAWADELRGAEVSPAAAGEAAKAHATPGD